MPATLSTSAASPAIARILLFGPLARTAGAGALELPLSTGRTTLAALRVQLEAAYPALAAMLASHRFAVNSQFARDDQSVNPADEIALIGLVSGG